MPASRACFDDDAARQDASSANRSGDELCFLLPLLYFIYTRYQRAGASRQPSRLGARGDGASPIATPLGLMPHLTIRPNAKMMKEPHLRHSSAAKNTTRAHAEAIWAIAISHAPASSSARRFTCRTRGKTARRRHYDSRGAPSNADKHDRARALPLSRQDFEALIADGRYGVMPGIAPRERRIKSRTLSPKEPAHDWPSGLQPARGRRFDADGPVQSRRSQKVKWRRWRARDIGIYCRKLSAAARRDYYFLAEHHAGELFDWPASAGGSTDSRDDFDKPRAKRADFLDASCACDKKTRHIGA